MIIWIIGLSGAGKSTIGRTLHRQWKAENPATVLVDGDEVRRIFAQDRTPSDYSIEGRRRNAERLFEICRWLDGERINVVCCVLSIFPDVLARNRRVFSQYFEVFVEVPLKVLIQRDNKGLYRPAIEGRASHVVGVDIDFPTPATPDLVIDNKGFDRSPDSLGETIMRAAGIRGTPPDA